MSRVATGSLWSFLRSCLSPLAHGSLRILRGIARQAKFRGGGRLLLAGWAILGFWLLVALGAEVFAQGSPVQSGDLYTERLQPPSRLHWFGTDEQARDIWTRVLYGARHTLLSIGIVIGTSLFLGISIGILAGFRGGRMGTLLMGMVGILFAFPRFMLALALALCLGGGLVGTAFSIGCTLWPGYARIACAEARVARKHPHVEAARLQRAPTSWILCQHILPLCFIPVVVRMTMDMSAVVVLLSSLGFLGIGVEPPAPEWGMMIAGGTAYPIRYWWVSAFPALAVFTLSLGFTFSGDGLSAVYESRKRT